MVPSKRDSDRMAQTHGNSDSTVPSHGVREYLVSSNDGSDQMNQSHGESLGVVRRTVSLKCHLVSNFSHSTSYCESKNTWTDPHHLHLTLRFHFSIIIGITMGNEPTNRISLRENFLMVLVQF